MQNNLSATGQAVNDLQDVFQRLFDRMNAGLKENDTNLGNFTKSLQKFRDANEKTFGDAVTNAIKGSDGFGGAMLKMKSSLEDLVIQMAVVNPLLNTLFGNDRGTINNFSSFANKQISSGTGGLVGDLFGGILGLFDARAFGGPVNAGQPYLVGERGPELFVPQAAGRIQSNGGGGGVNITMNITANDAASFRASQNQIAAAMMDAARRANRIR